jgi:hypothetical protein
MILLDALARMDILIPILCWMIAIAALTIAGYILHVRRGHPKLVRLCRFAFWGVSFGFAAGVVAHSYSDGFTGWITRQSFVPSRVCGGRSKSGMKVAV